MHILGCVGSKFCAKFQRAPLKFQNFEALHRKICILLKNFNICVWLTTSLNCDVIRLSETGPWACRPPDRPLCPRICAGSLSGSPQPGWTTPKRNITKHIISCHFVVRCCWPCAGWWLGSVGSMPIVTLRILCVVTRPVRHTLMGSSAKNSEYRKVVVA